MSISLGKVRGMEALRLLGGWASMTGEELSREASMVSWSLGQLVGANKEWTPMGVVRVCE